MTTTDDQAAVPTLDLDLTSPEPIPEAGIAKAVDLMRSGRLFRYGETAPGQLSPAADLEQKFATAIGRRYAIGVNSCGAALFLALRASGVAPGDRVLVNGFTLAPVPGAIAHAGGVPVIVEIDQRCMIDLDDLEQQAAETGAKTLLLSHMRGHISNLDEVMTIATRHGINVIEDCAHTLGANWVGRPTGSFGVAGCFSLQTFKHINAGEGGIIVTDDPDLAAQAIILSGSYMLYPQHAARPDEEAFEKWRAVTPNFSLRLSALAATVALPQLDELDERIRKMNHAYERLAAELSAIDGVEVIERDPREEFVGSSLQLRLPSLDAGQIGAIIDFCRSHKLDLKWFGQERMEGFTSRPAQWKYITPSGQAPRTEEILRSLCDMRIPPSMTADHCRQIATIVAAAVHNVTHQQ